MPELRLSTAAEEDLRAIRIFSKQRFGVAVAKAYLLGLRSAFGRLRERPGSGSVEDDLVAGLRSIGYRSHRIYYLADGDDLLIVRILHHAQDKTRLTDA